MQQTASYTTLVDTPLTLYILGVTNRRQGEAEILPISDQKLLFKFLLLNGLPASISMKQTKDSLQLTNLTEIASLFVPLTFDWSEFESPT